MDRICYFHFLHFFTTWVFLIVLFHGILHKHFDIVMLTFMTLVISLYMSFIKPARFSFMLGTRKIEMTGWQKFIVTDLLIHTGMFCFAVYKYGFQLQTPKHIFNTVMLFLIYITAIDPFRIYGVTLMELFQLFWGSFAIFFMIHKI
jgi:hypothetical protein